MNKRSILHFLATPICLASAIIVAVSCAVLGILIGLGF